MRCMVWDALYLNLTSHKKIVPCNLKLANVRSTLDSIRKEPSLMILGPHSKRHLEPTCQTANGEWNGEGWVDTCEDGPHSCVHETPTDWNGNRLYGINVIDTGCDLLYGPHRVGNSGHTCQPWKEISVGISVGVTRGSPGLICPWPRAKFWDS